MSNAMSKPEPRRPKWDPGERNNKPDAIRAAYDAVTDCMEALAVHRTTGGSDSADRCIAVLTEAVGALLEAQFELLNIISIYEERRAAAEQQLDRGSPPSKARS